MPRFIYWLLYRYGVVVSAISRAVSDGRNARSDAKQAAEYAQWKRDRLAYLEAWYAKSSAEP